MEARNIIEHINYESWPRRRIFEFFSGMSNPFYMVTFRQDVSELYNFAKKNGLSFYYCMIWICTQAINDIEDFLLCLHDRQIVRIARRNPSFTDLRPGASQFHIVTMDTCGDIFEFCREAKQRSAEQCDFIDEKSENDALIYFSCLPWVELTALTNERDLSLPGALDDSVPRIAWGKYTNENGNKTLCISIEVNHRFIDGLHIGRFAEILSHLITGLSSR